MLPTGMLKKTTFIKILTSTLLSIYFPVHSDIETPSTLATSEGYFIVTGYYSPLPDQEDYITGSYAWDIRLNGGWVNSASWNQVLTGVIAAPSTYPFGTKIYLDEYGVGVVEDRGWAIVNAGERGHEYDRIDVWMGYGDEWRIRAINWWKRTVKWKIVDVDEMPSLELSNGISHKEFTSIKVTPESDSESIIQLQKFLANLGKYDGSINGNYDDVFQPLIDFQRELWIIQDSEDWGAGYFWPKTVEAIKMKYGFGIGLVKKEFELSAKDKQKLDKLIAKIDQKLGNIKNENKRNKAKLKLIDDIDKLIRRNIDLKLNIKLQYLKENF